MKRGIAIVLATSLLLLFVLLMWWFQPWRLVTQSVLVEPVPSSSPSETNPQADLETSQGQKGTPTPGSTPEQTSSPEPRILLSGELISHEHNTSGTVKVLELEDGTRVLRLEGFHTSDGPDLEVWLSDAPVIEGYDGWFLADDGEFLSLGKLKGTKGNQNYNIPADANLDMFSSMSIWCVRFAVSFGAAELAKAT